MSNIHNKITEDYIEQFHENTKILRHQDLPAAGGVKLVFHDELYKTELEGEPIASDILDENGSIYKYSDYIKLPKQKQKSCRLRYLYKAPYHTLALGGTGMGKTTGYVEPKVRAVSSQQNKPNLIITDPKGEIFNRNATHLKKQGYNVQVLNFKDPTKSEKWNPFFELYKKREQYNHSHGNEKAILEIQIGSIINDLANIFVKVESQTDPSWDQGSRRYFKGLLHCLLKEMDNPSNGFECDHMTIYTLMRLHNLLTEEIMSDEDRPAMYSLNSHRLTKDMPRDTRYLLNAVLKNAPRTARSYENVFTSKICDWTQAHIYELTTGHTINLDNSGDKPFAFFIITRDYIESDYMIAGLAIDWAYRQMIEKAEKEPKLTNKRATHFFLDEFGNIPQIKDFKMKITSARSRNIWFHLAIQSDSQLESRYGADAAREIRDNSYKIFLGSPNYDTKANFSRECGEHTVARLSSWYHEEDRGLITLPIVSVSKLSNIQDGQMYVIPAKGYPFMSRFVRSYEAADMGVYEDFFGGLADELLDNVENFNSPKYFYGLEKKNKSTKNHNSYKNIYNIASLGSEKECSKTSNQKNDFDSAIKYVVKELFKIADNRFDLIELLKLVLTRSFVSVGMLQRSFMLGFSKAAAILDILQDGGIIGGKSEKPGGAREVMYNLSDLDGAIEGVMAYLDVEAVEDEIEEDESQIDIEEAIGLLGDFDEDGEEI